MASRPGGSFVQSTGMRLSYVSEHMFAAAAVIVSGAGRADRGNRAGRDGIADLLGKKVER